MPGPGSTPKEVTDKLREAEKIVECYGCGLPTDGSCTCAPPEKKADARPWLDITWIALIMSILAFASALFNLLKP